MQEQQQFGPALDEAGKPLPIRKEGLGQGEQTDYVTSILPVEGAPPLVCGAGSGVIQLGEQLATMPREAGGGGDADADNGGADLAPFPSPAASPSVEELQALTQEVQGLQTPHAAPWAQVLDDDWNTKGDWMGRYGTRYAMLCAMQAPFDQFVINDPSYEVLGRLGVHPYKDGKNYEEQGLRHWLHRERWDDPRVLYNPLIGYRRQADIDDNGESYSMNYEGPDIWLGVRIPSGTHKVSLYFFNKDGHDGANRIRDYLIDVKRGGDDLVAANQTPTLARARVHDFWGGVYKSFLVQGPGDYLFAVRKNNTFNTVLQGVFIDKLDGAPTGYEARRDVWLGQVRYDAPGRREGALIEDGALAALAHHPRAQAQLSEALGLWQGVEDASGAGGVENVVGVSRLLAYRAARGAILQSGMSLQTDMPLSSPTAKARALLGLWRWRLPLWPAQDRAFFQSSMARGRKSYEESSPEDGSSPR